MTQFIDKSIDRDLLYHHPRVDLRPPVFGVNVDNWWTGGIDDVVPTGHPCTVGGEELPYLGELWSVPWDLEVLDSSSIRLTGRGTITPLSLRKTLTLLPGERQLRAQYELANTGFVRFPYLWGVHPALPIGPRTRVDVPAREAWYSDGDVAPDEPSLGPGQAVAAPWPVPSLERLKRAAGGTWVHLYLSALQDGWVTVSDAEEGWGFGVRFSTGQFSDVHLWLVDGGWRGLRCVAIEPWTGRPSRLDQAIEQGRARWLALVSGPPPPWTSSRLHQARIRREMPGICRARGRSANEIGQMRLAGKVAVVTGAAGGIGSAVCRRFAEEGCAVICVDRSADALGQVVDQVRAAGTSAVAPLAADISTDQGNHEAVAAAVGHFGGLDIFHANAAVQIMGGLESTTPADWTALYTTNLYGVASGFRHALPALRARGGGSLIATSSLLGIVGDPDLPAYGAMKGGLRALARSMAAAHGIDRIPRQHDLPRGRRDAIAAGLLFVPTRPGGRESQDSRPLSAQAASPAGGRGQCGFVPRQRRVELP